MNPYLGSDSVEPFIQACRRTGAGIFCLVKTSNAGGADVQDLTLSDGRPLWQQVAALVKEWGEGLYGFEFAHKVRVDKDDNVWAVDEGTNMVIKFNPEGRVVMEGDAHDAVEREGGAATIPSASWRGNQRCDGRPALGDDPA